VSITHLGLRRATHGQFSAAMSDGVEQRHGFAVDLQIQLFRVTHHFAGGLVDPPA
jgi:hypothetical protein